MTARITPAQRAARAYRAGATLREVAAERGVHESTVRGWLRAEAVAARRLGPRGRLDVADGLILGLRDVDGLSWQDVADAVGMSKSGVRSRYAVATGQGRPR